MKKNEKGFSAVVVVLIILVAGMIGFVGWKAYSNDKNPKQNTNNTAQVTLKEHTDTSSTLTLGRRFLMNYQGMMVQPNQSLIGQKLRSQSPYVTKATKMQKSRLTVLRMLLRQLIRK